MSQPFSFDELARSMRSFRRGIDLDRAVPREMITDSLAVAVQAASGSNRQHWRFLVIENSDQRTRVADAYRRGFYDNLRGRTPSPDQLADLRSSEYLADHLADVPVLILVCQAGRPPGHPAKLASFYGSVLPAVWNLMLALRSRDIGSTLTTAHLANEQEVADALGIPFDEVTQIALVAAGYLRADVAPGAAPRIPATEVTFWNRWGHNESASSP